MRPGCQFNHIVDAITFHGRAAPAKRTLADQVVGQQAVVALAAAPDRYRLSAAVMDSEEYCVDLLYLPDERKWTGHCTSEPLAQRVRVVPLRPIIDAELSSRSRSTAYCLLSITAESPEGRHRHTLTGEGWQEDSGEVDAARGGWSTR